MTADAVMGWAVQTGLVVSLLIVLILLIRRPFARWFGAGPAYALWSLPLIRICLPVIAVPEAWLPRFLRPQIEVAPDTAVLPPQDLSNLLTGETDLAATAIDPAGSGFPLIGLLLLLWLGVAALWLAYQLLRQNKFQSRLRQETSAPSESLSKEAKASADLIGLNTLPELRIADGEIGPLVTGVLRPLVILPAHFEETFDARQRHFALAHEFAHIKRRDLWVAFTVLIFRALNWFNPLVHFASHRLRADQEAACDAYVVAKTGGETAHPYAETLVKAVRSGGSGRAANAHLALSLADEEISKGDTK